jgi:hypothetical protein
VLEEAVRCGYCDELIREDLADHIAAD